MSRAPSDSGTSELQQLAVALRANTVKLRFFRGATYDGDADTYLTQLTQFIDAVMPMLDPAQQPRTEGPFKDGDPIVAALIWEVDRAVKQALRDGGKYETAIRWILNEHLRGFAQQPLDRDTIATLTKQVLFYQEEVERLNGIIEKMLDATG
jgi:hypothetical protein